MNNIDTAFDLHYQEASTYVGERGKVVMLSLQGSQNYGTHTEKSDVDTKAVVIPSLRSILAKDEILKDMDISNGEKCSVKEFPSFINMFFKGNVNALEMLFTDYYLFKDDEFRIFFLSKIVPLRDEIVRCTMGTIEKACIGMMENKFKSLLKPTASTQEFFDKHGYDGKDFTHINRLYYLLLELRSDTPFKRAIYIGDGLLCHHVKAIRNGVFDKASAIEISEKMIAFAKESSVSTDFKEEKTILHDTLHNEYINFLEKRILG